MRHDRQPSWLLNADHEQVLGRRNGVESSENEDRITTVLATAEAHEDVLARSVEMGMSPSDEKRRIRELVAEMNHIQTDIESMAVTSSNCKMAPDKTKKKLNQEMLSVLPLARAHLGEARVKGHMG